jgi:hypothetical protein
MSSNALLATTRKVLFIGNSYTYTNSMPAMLASFATAKGDTLIYDESVPGGYTFEQHTTNTTTIAKIYAQRWDLVTLQEQSQRPSFPPAQVETEVYPYARKLDSMIHDNDSCTQSMFMMTWGRQAGDRANCGFYPVVCTYAGMQGRLRTSYMEMAQDNRGIVAPVGAAWKVIMDSFPSINLYSPDSSHPSIYGSYLQTCVMYGSVYHKKSFGCSYLAGIPLAEAQTLQRIADKVTMDSLAIWQQYGQYPAAIATRTIAGTTVTFTSRSPVGAGHAWSFGDSGTDTATNPVHTYASTGSYVVRHTVTTDCFTETQTDTLFIGTTGLQQIDNQDKAIAIGQEGNGYISFIPQNTTEYTTLEVFDSMGRKVRKYTQSGNTIRDQFAPGVYFIRASNTDGSKTFNGRFVAY